MVRVGPYVDMYQDTKGWARWPACRNGELLGRAFRLQPKCSPHLTFQTEITVEQSGRLAIIALAALSLTIALAAPSAARIKCKGPWQIINGSPHASPYCGDNYLARVARGYGMRVTGRQLRRSIAIKDEVCQLVGHDNRVSDICTGFRIENDSDRGGFGHRR